MERTMRANGNRSGWMSLGLLLGAWLLLVPAAVQAEPATGQAEQGSAAVQQENLQAELTSALQRIESLEKQAKVRQANNDLSWVMMVESGF